MEMKPCSIEDIPALLKVSNQSYRENYRYLWHDNGEHYIEDNFNSKSFELQLKDKNVALFLVLEDDQPVGFLKLNIDSGYADHNASDTLELERIYLIKSASGRGLGKKVFDFVSTFAQKKNKKCIWLKCMDSGNALKFYKREGYDIITPWRLNLPFVKDEFRGMHVMMKKL